MLQVIADLFTYNLLNLNAESKIGQVVNFFIYDSIKIILFLFIFISFIGFLRSFIPSWKITEWIQKKNRLTGHLGASLFGSITPFCSCSSIPIFLSFIKAGIPLGIMFSFLITAPLLNEYLFVLMLGYFGVKISILYALSGILIGVIAGLILGKMKLEKDLEPDIVIKESDHQKETFPTFLSRIKYGLSEGTSIVHKIWKWILLGVGIGALIHNYVPSQTIQTIVIAGGIFTVPLAVVLGIPMYGSCAAIVPIAVVLFNKGAPLGTALAFMMAVSALSLPEAIILRRALKLKLIGIFFGIVFIGIVFTGYIFNILEGWIL